MRIRDYINDITVVNLLSRKCLKRPCYIPRISSHNDNIQYVCGRRDLHGCPVKYIEEANNYMGFTVIQYGVVLDESRYNWNSKNRIFKSDESDIIISYLENISTSFNIANNCLINVFKNSEISTLNDCIINTGSDCCITAKDNCLIVTGERCVIKAGDNCNIITLNDCNITVDNNCNIISDSTSTVTNKDDCVISLRSSIHD